MRNRRWRRRFLQGCITGERDAGDIPRKYISSNDGARWFGVRIEKILFKMYLHLEKGRPEREAKLCKITAAVP